MKRVANFVPNRLIEAREARGLTIKELAQMVAISATTLSAYENGRSAPGDESLVKLAATLKFPERFFTRLHANGTGHDGPVFWRSRSYAKQAARTRCKNRLTWLSEITSFVRQFLELPTVNLPKIPLPSARVVDWTLAQVEEMAARTRQELGLGDGPIPDVLLLLENAGIVVSKFDLDGDGLDAMSWWSTDGTPFVVIANDVSFARQQYNAAHEFAHLLMHRSLTETDAKTNEIHKIVEGQAFRFASSFLLPEQQFASELWAPTFRAFESLKPRWRASMGVMLTRCRELGIVDEKQAQRMWILYSRLGYKKVEPLDDVLPNSNPRLLRRSIEMIVDEGIQSRDNIRAALALPDAEIEALCSLRPGYLLDDAAQAPVMAMPRLKEADVPSPTGPSSGAPRPVLPFGRK